MGDILKYKEELKRTMEFLSKHDNVVFVGQQIKYGGFNMFHSLSDIPDEKKIEMPLIEDTQLGMCIGMAMQGLVPICIYPRMDFFIIAVNQLVNHLDKIYDMSCGQFNPQVIIRTAVGSTMPLYPGVQHCGDYVNMLRAGLDNVPVYTILKPDDVFYVYKKVLLSGKSAVIVEYSDLYDMEY